PPQTGLFAEVVCQVARGYWIAPSPKPTSSFGTAESTGILPMHNSTALGGLRRLGCSYSYARA
ncbi:MAG: hypothetical protein NZ571_06015, partial [Anaerolineae bacterium]|nr:hypothetical protein [Anaerolineae bacterium]